MKRVWNAGYKEFGKYVNCCRVLSLRLVSELSNTLQQQQNKIAFYSVSSGRLRLRLRQDICIASFREKSPIKRSEWHVLTRDHTVLPATNTLIHERNESSCFDSQPQRITAFHPVLISRPTKGRKLSWPGWLVTYRGGIPRRRSPIPIPSDR